MLTLRTAVPGVRRPLDAGRRRARRRRPRLVGLHPAGRRQGRRCAVRTADPAQRPAARPAHGAIAPHRSHSARSVGLVAGVVAAVLLTAAVVVPKLGGGDNPAPAASAPTAAAPGQGSERGAPRPAVPAIDVPKGLLGWPARGALADDPALVAAATGAWKAGVPAAEAPASGVTVLWAGTLDRRAVAVVQGLDRAGRPHLAQVAGATSSALKLQHAEPLHGGTQVLTLLPPAPSGPVRVLVSPEAQVADGLLASNPMDGKPLQHMVLGDGRHQRHPAVPAGRPDLQPGRPARSRPGQLADRRRQRPLQRDHERRHARRHAGRRRGRQLDAGAVAGRACRTRRGSPTARSWRRRCPARAR